MIEDRVMMIIAHFGQLSTVKTFTNNRCKYEMNMITSFVDLITFTIYKHNEFFLKHFYSLASIDVRCTSEQCCTIDGSNI